MHYDGKDFDKFAELVDKYMPRMGEGETMASQAATAYNRLVYKWFNDGDVYDNTGLLEGWANDLSSEANWLWKNLPATRLILDQVYDCVEQEYTDLLYELGEFLMDEDWLESLNKSEKHGSIYEAEGPFRFVEMEDEDEDLYW